jgi:hypothetical protein
VLKRGGPVSAKDKLLALRAQTPATTPQATAPKEPGPKFPDRHCSECGEAGGDPLIEAEGYLWHRDCLAQRKGWAARAVTCWRCGKPTIRPRRLAWGKDIIPLHDHCCGPWIDAWDAMLARPEPSQEEEEADGE